MTIDVEEAFQRIKSGGGEVIVPLEYVYRIVPTNGRTAQPSLGDLKSNGFSQLIGGGRGTICNEVFEKPKKRKRPDEQPEGYLGFFRAKVICARVPSGDRVERGVGTRNGVRTRRPG